jgi:hypothetical protein
VNEIPDTEAKESLLKGKTKYKWPPYPNEFRSAAFDIVNTIYFLPNKTSCFNEEVTCTEPFPSVRVPCWCSWYFQVNNVALYTNDPRRFKVSLKKKYFQKH